MQCHLCNTINPAAARFCMHCGTKLVQGQVCTECHTLLPPQATYCYHCGCFLGQANAGGALMQGMVGGTAAQGVAPVPVPSVVQTPDQPAAPVSTVAVPAQEPESPISLPPGQQLPAPRPLEELRPSLQDYLPKRLYEPLERHPKEQDLVAVRDHLTALVQTCKTYLPRQVIESPQPPGVPHGGMQRGVFLFGDVSGFTPLSEKLKALGQVGAEQITGIINALFTELTKTLFEHGGTLLKFGGDAMLGMWPGETPEEMAQAALYACQAALAIQEVLKQPHFAQINALGEQHTLLIKVGISAGPFFAAHVGTPPSRNDKNGTMVFITTGETVNLAEESEGHAHPGQVAMTKVVADLVESQVTLGPVEREPDENYRRLLAAPPLSARPQSSVEMQEPPAGALDAQITYLAERLNRLTPYLSDELVARVVQNPKDARIQPEHRAVTVMFVNYKGISKLIDKYGERDPGLITQHLNNYFCKMASIVEHYEGTVARMDQYAVGDRIVIFFGAPRTHEDDPLRAVYTALEMQETVRKDFAALRTSSGVFRFEQRVGINTGHLFAGNAGAPDLRQEYTLMGDDINMAARLMSNAPWGQIYVSRRTREHVAAFIELEDRGEIQVKGKQIKIPTFAAIGRRGEVGRTRGLDSGESPYIGRESQLLNAQEHARQFLNGRGQILAFSGHSGLGKSRLLKETKAWLYEQPQAANIQWAEARALSFSEQTGYWMASQMMRSLLQVSPNTSQDDVLFRLSERGEALLGDVSMDAIPYLAHMMGLELGEEWAWVKKEDPKVRQKQTFWAANEMIRAAAKEHPLVIALDDLHWADEASLALFTNLLRVTDQAPVLLCLLFRPLREQECWKLRDAAAGQFPHRYHELALEPLGKDESNLLLDRLLPGAHFPTQQREDILEKSAGNPFYLEEMVRSLIETGAVIPHEAKPGQWQVTEALGKTAIPVNLHAAIAARIDRLTEDSRQALQMAAVIGRQFRLELLQSLSHAAEEINLWMAQLERVGLVSASNLSDDMLYSFPDALVHEVAYDSLLVMKRQQIHRQVGELLENYYGDEAPAQYGILAYQFSNSDDTEKALKYLQMAAKKSEEQYANATAIAAYKKILEIYQRKGDLNGQAGTLYAMGVKGYEIGDYERARFWLDVAAELQRQLKDPKNEAWSSMYLGMIELKQGNYSKASQYHQNAFENARQRQDSFQEGIHLTNLARVTMRMGQYDLALEQFRQSLALKKSNNDVTGQAFALFYLGLTSLLTGSLAEAEQYLNDSQAMWQNVAFNERGLAYVEQGFGLLAIERQQYDDAVKYLYSALARCEKLVLKAEQIENLSHLGKALLASGNQEGAIQASGQAIELLAKQKDVEAEQQVYFTHYQVLRAAGDSQAEEYLRCAAAEVKEQAMRLETPSPREDFLNKVRVNREIVSAAYDCFGCDPMDENVDETDELESSD